MDQIEALLSDEDREGLDSEIGLVGMQPLFFDKETGQITPVHFWYSSMEVLLEKLREEKTGKPGVWCVYLTQSLTGQTEKITKIRERLSLSAAEVMKHMRQIEIPLFQGSISNAWTVNQDLNQLGIETRLVKLES